MRNKGDVNDTIGDTECLSVRTGTKERILKWVGITGQDPYTQPFSLEANAGGVTMEKFCLNNLSACRLFTYTEYY